MPLAAEAVVELRDLLRKAMQEEAILGLVIVSPEGINGTVSGPGDLQRFKDVVAAACPDRDIRFKDSTAVVCPFKRCSVVIRKEIVGMKRTDLVPETTEDHHLSPAEWHEMLTGPNPPPVIDTRNDYEYMVGAFKGAVNPNIRSFSAWSDYLRGTAYSRQEPVLIYCTGGIRCAKAILAMREEGFEKVYQLRDGILGYLAEFPEGEYEGECYVFDERVAVDAHLAPSERFGNCPGCGLPSEVRHTCDWCETSYFSCPACRENWGPVCSKPCRDRWQRHGSPQTTGRSVG